MKTLAEIQQLIETEIKNLDWKNEPYGLYEPIEYTLSLGGKRIRPALVLMAVDMFDENIVYAVAPTLALEIFHNFTLLHDDVMDNADVRRGQPTVHKKWNENTAILSGDQMLIESYRMLSKIDANYLPMVLELFTNMATEICEGQQYDMEFEQRQDVSIDEYLHMIRLKTGVLLGTSLKIGAIMANASDLNQQQLYSLGINLGLAFQLRDDYLDVYGDEATFGKAIGGDILCNKKTFLLINALQSADEATKQRLIAWMNEDNKPQEKIAAVTAIYNELNIDQKCKEAIDFYHTSAMENLNNITLSEDRKLELKQLMQKLMHRND